MTVPMLAILRLLWRFNKDDVFVRMLPFAKSEKRS